MARLYSNENLAIDLVEALRKFNHDILSSYDAGQANQGIPDDEVLKYATLNDRCVITFNRDDFVALHRNGVSHAGIIICKDDRDYLRQAQVLHDYLETQDRLHNRLIRVQRQNQPNSSQKLFVIREYLRQMRKIDLPIILDGKPVEKITAFLFHAGGNNDPQKLIANEDKSFQGSVILGLGFTFDDSNINVTSIAEMQRLIEENPRNQECIFPYIGGEEVNSSPTHTHHRYVINFAEMSEEEAREWPDLISIVEDKVKPERAKLNMNTADGRRRASTWWLWGRYTNALFKAIEPLDRVLVSTQISKYRMLTFLPKGYVYDQRLVVFTFDTYSSFTILHSRIHEIWVIFMGASIKDDPIYTPSDCFQTFPFPENWETNRELESIGQEYYEFRAALMIRNNQGLTATYNRFHDPEEDDADILKLRQLHTQMDTAVLAAYG
ncbi:DUF5615 family PIN-like protein [Chamaesiphon sp.]|uniref:DUF5615 family PIN-like protein n=1 Tax=Chamaesiphon sp. TaxID=2814140 RepID=UPI00359395E1